MVNIGHLSVLISCLMVFGCTPKVTEETAKPAEPVVEEESNEVYPCITWSNKTFEDDIVTSFVLYRDFLKNKNYDEAWPYWQSVYEKAPAADGKRKSVFEDGIKFYKEFFRRSQDETERAGYVQRIMRLHDQIGECYESEPYAAGRKAFDYYFSFQDYVDGKELYTLFKQYVDEYGLKSNYFIVNPFAAILVDEYFKEEGSIPMDEAHKYALTLLAILETGLDKCQNEKECEPWKIVESYTPERLAEFERVRGFYDCGYYTRRYAQDFRDNPDDCDVIETLMIRYKWAGCSPEMSDVAPVIGAYRSKCRPATQPGCMSEVRTLLEEGKYRDAIDKISSCIDQVDDVEKKGTYALLASKIYYSHLRNFRQAREWAQKAAKYRPDWGEPYILIGKLYASSGPLCGPGRGWDSQVVTWVAVDMFKKAKKIDPSISAEANKWIRTYCQYFPSKEDIFQRTLNEGETYFVPCWIQRSTSIRTPCGN